LQRATHADKSLFACCIDLDRTALNTVRNAAESERWIRANDYHRVIVVTNNYHIPRSILEMSSRMKDVEFIPYPAVNGEKREQSWVAEGDTLRVLFTEYVKYLGAVVRLGSASFYGNGGSHGGDMRE
ncbi:YdcF family protein, partial [Brucella melitensis]|uniref:YdcF family protein n=1 Tax=Brucella melitensis TaxID=29459 RepID=UPI0031FBE09D